MAPLRSHERISAMISSGTYEGSSPLIDTDARGLVEAEKAEVAELLEQLVRGEGTGRLPLVDKGIDLARDEFCDERRAAGAQR